MRPGAIPYMDERVSFGIAAGTAGGADAIALGVRVQLSERSRLSATLMRTARETGAAVGIGFSF